MKILLRIMIIINLSQMYFRQKTYSHVPIQAPLHAFNLQEPLPAKNPEMFQFPHSALNLVTKNKVSPTIYKYMHQSPQKYRPKSSTHSLSGAYRKESPEVSRIVLEQHIEESSKIVDHNQKDNNQSKIYNNNYKRFPQRSLFLKNNQKNPYFSSTEHFQKRNQGPHFDLTTISGQTIEFTELFKSKVQPKITPLKQPTMRRASLVNKVKKRTQSSHGRMRSADKFSPWDLDSGFGKKGRF